MFFIFIFVIMCIPHRHSQFSCNWKLKKEIICLGIYRLFAFFPSLHYKTVNIWGSCKISISDNLQGKLNFSSGWPLLFSLFLKRALILSFIIQMTYGLIFNCCSSFTLWNPMDCSRPVSPVLHYYLEFAQTRVHCVDDAI